MLAPIDDPLDLLGLTNLSFNYMRLAKPGQWVSVLTHRLAPRDEC